MNQGTITRDIRRVISLNSQVGPKNSLAFMGQIAAPDIAGAQGRKIEALIELGRTHHRLRSVREADGPLHFQLLVWFHGFDGPKDWPGFLEWRQTEGIKTPLGPARGENMDLMLFRARCTYRDAR